MDRRMVGIVSTVLTVLCCACPGFGICIFGGMIAAGQPVTTTVNGVESVQTYPQSYGIVMLCLALILIAIPVVVGFFAFRAKPAAASTPVPTSFDGPVPPAS
jgi:hypothetical protein